MEKQSELAEHLAEIIYERIYDTNFSQVTINCIIVEWAIDNNIKFNKE